MLERLKDRACAGSILYWFLFMMFMTWLAVKPQFLIRSELLLLLMLGAVGWLWVIPMLKNSLKKQWEIGQKEIGMIKTAFLTQASVDKVLRDMAVELQSQSVVEIKLRGMDNAKTQLKEHEDLLRESEAAFWATLRLVQRLGFSVYSRLQDYIDYT